MRSALAWTKVNLVRRRRELARDARCRISHRARALGVRRLGRSSVRCGTRPTAAPARPRAMAKARAGRSSACGAASSCSAAIPMRRSGGRSSSSSCSRRCCFSVATGACGDAGSRRSGSLGLGVNFVLMLGGVFGLAYVPTDLWSGLPLTLILAIVGLAAAFPLAILLALGRRSEMPAVRALSVAYIELIRGVPLITVLFMASVMLPLFLPGGTTIDKLLRAQVGFVLFYAAYLAEVVRGGLQAMPKGQYEAADALGLSLLAQDAARSFCRRPCRSRSRRSSTSSSPGSRTRRSSPSSACSISSRPRRTRSPIRTGAASMSRLMASSARFISCSASSCRAIAGSLEAKFRRGRR